ncbi:hypothetical protein LRX76_04430 [Stenotrophomonas sp. MMGLT7]|nr:hypothetical protein [Stenotrophomonas sp. MMGLT7]MCD7097671.1 hypothetical protein [Stenotrophomonas sp. MMGLT7]
MKRILLAALLAAQALIAGHAAAQPEYVDAIDYPGNADGWEIFHALERRLFLDFEQICGDTFCEGEFSDYRPLRYR